MGLLDWIKMLSIITVTWNSYDFLKILTESLSVYTNIKYDIIVIDNSVNPIKLDDSIIHIVNKTNIGHGAGLNQGSLIAKNLNNPYVLFLDVDTHFVQHGWDEVLTNLKGVIVAKGVPVKPIRPAFLLTTKDIAASYDWAPTPGYQGHRITPTGFDVAIKAFYEMSGDGIEIQYLNSFPNRYDTLTGEEWGFDTPFIYHHWHGSHLKERQVDFQQDLMKEKEKLFNQIPWRHI